MAKKDSAEARVKELLVEIEKIDGGREAMLEILWRRQIVAELRRVRLAKRLTQDQVAESMGVSQSQIAEMENAQWPDPHLSTLRRYALAMGAMVSIEVYPADSEEESGEH